MAFFSCEVVSNPSGLLPYKVVFKRHGSVLGEWPVSSIAEGEAQIAAAFRSIGDVVSQDILDAELPACRPIASTSCATCGRQN
jgi:hypothetical protein